MDSSVPGQADLQAGSRPVSETIRSRVGAASATGTVGPKRPLDRTLGGDRGDMRQHRVRSGRVDVVVLSGGGRGIPAVDDDLGEGDNPAHLAGKVDAAGA